MKSQGKSRRVGEEQPETGPDGHYFGVTVKVTLDYGGNECISQEKADLLAALHQAQNLSAASKQLGISYRHAWQLLKDLNESTQTPFVETVTGGATGGLTKLTSFGETALEFYQATQREIRKHAAEVVQKRVANLQRGRSDVRLFAAISLQNFISQVVAEFGLSQPTINISTAYAASDQLDRMIREGTQFDVFVSGDREQLSELQRQGIIADVAIKPIARNSLILVSSRTAQIPDSDIQTILEKQTSRVIVANESSPLGRLTSEWLAKSRLNSTIKDKCLRVDNSAAVIPALRSNAGSVGIAFASQSIECLDMTVLQRIAPDDCSLTYWLGHSSGSTANIGVTQLCRFLTSYESRSIATRCGLGVV